MRKATLGFALAAFLLLAVGVVVVAADSSRNFRAHLDGAGARPTAVLTSAQGQSIFQLSDDGQRMDYKLIASNIDNVFMAHIHVVANPDGSGPIVVWLYPATPFAPSQTVPPASWIQGRTDGVLAEGSFTAANLTGPLAGQTLSALLAKINDGTAYVNIHTSDFVLPNNTGAGDMFSGEVSGGIH
ncbi:MAG: CHRD domain-containing protein [Chloroflexota bacterium]